MSRADTVLRALAFALATLVCACGGSRINSGSAPPALAPTSAEPMPAGQERRSNITSRERVCVRVIDGDTIELDGGEKVRYIGIDTPETKHPRKRVQWMGPEATAANRRLVEGRRVRLVYDVQRTDKYSRTLAYVLVGDVMVNERLVRAGYAQVSTYPPNVKHVDRFLAAQKEARLAGRGLWGEGADPARDPLLVLGSQKEPETEPAEEPRRKKQDARTVYITRTGSKYHRDGCQYLRQSRIPCPLHDAVARGYGACKRCRP